MLALYEDYDLDPVKLREKIARGPLSAGDWPTLLTEHPEFFRKSEHEGDFCLILRRAKSKTTERTRPPLDPSELALLINTAIHLHKHALELKREDRARLPVIISAIGIAAAFAGTILGAILKGS